MTKNKKNPTPQPSPKLSAALLGVAVAETLLSVYQWYELVQLRHGERPSCSINSFLDCEAVWNSPIAGFIHERLGVPVAGLGLVWGLTAAVLAFVLVARLRQGGNTEAAVVGTRILSAFGLLAVAGFAGESFHLGAVCLTCLGTYALTLVFAALAWKVSPLPLVPEKAHFWGAAQWTAGAGVGAYVLALLVGLGTPRAATGAAVLERADSPEVREATSDEAKLQRYIAGLPPQERQELSTALGFYRITAAQDASRHPIRKIYGSPDAPLRMVEFTDIRCPHCRHLEEAVQMLKKVVPPGSISIEARQFPLDSDCNPVVGGSDHQGVRCLAAKAQICLESTPDLWDIRGRLFAAQESLTSDKVMEIASSGSMKRDELQRCMDSAETMAKLLDDVAYANDYHADGTPLVLLNGRESMPVPSLLYTLAVTKGDPNSPAFNGLPPPQLAQ